MTPAPNGGYKQVDLTIRSSLAGALRIELFNSDNSQSKVENPGLNNYEPMAGHTNAGIPLLFSTAAPTETTTLTWQTGIFVGSSVPFTDNTAPYAGNSPNAVYFNKSGALVYQPGYVSGVLPTGNVTIQSASTNYRHLLDVASKSEFTIAYIKMKVQMSHLTQLQQPFQYTELDVTGDKSNNSFSPDAFESENQNQPNMVTMPVNKVINPRTGFTLNVLGKLPNDASVDVDNVISLSLKIAPGTPGMFNS